MSKQTAMQQMYDELIAYEYIIPLDLIVKCRELIKMEREQIEIAYWVGGQDIPYSAKQCEQYYNETYGEKFGENYGGEK